MKRYVCEGRDGPGAASVQVMELVPGATAPQHENAPLFKSRPLDPRYDLRNHSPDGFNWGYAGSGPAQLALAILADLLGPEKALRYYQAFKFGVIARLPQGKAWSLDESSIMETVRIIERREALK